MMNNIKVDLSDIDKVVNALEVLYQDLKQAQKDIPKEIAEKGLKFLEKEYQHLYRDPNIDSISTRTEETAEGYNIIASGSDVVYAEFGTGDKGASDPHPDKSKYSLNPYNSGAHIRDYDKYITVIGNDGTPTINKKRVEMLAKKGITSGRFWAYDKNGEKQWTQGVPAGKQMFNTFNYLKDDEVSKIIKKRGEEINAKFINSIKG